MSEMNESAPPPPPMDGMSAPSDDDKQMGMFAHLSALLTIGPLIIWLMNKDNPAKGFVNMHAKEALNFVITIWIVMIAAMVVMTVLAFIPVLGWIAGMLIGLLMAVVGLAAVVFIIIAAMKANEGGDYRYPVNIRLVK
jgi:uncharacterized Tic20 family protein